jgi:holo-[acyl-carrier protein] synthase
MNILGIGTDIVECPRIGKMIEQHGELFLRRVYTDREIRYCQARKHAIEHFAGRWAAKEAILKALGTGWSRGISWTDLEIRNDPSGRPKVMIRGGSKDVAIRQGITDVLISISHCRTYAVAYALATGIERPAGERRSAADNAEEETSLDPDLSGDGDRDDPGTETENSE